MNTPAVDANADADADADWTSVSAVDVPPKISTFVPVWPSPPPPPDVLVVFEKTLALLTSMDARLERLERAHERIAETMYQNDQRYRNYLLRTHQPFNFKADDHHGGGGGGGGGGGSHALMPDGPGRFVLPPASEKPPMLPARRGGRFF